MVRSWRAWATLAAALCLAIGVIAALAPAGQSSVEPTQIVSLVNSPRVQAVDVASGIVFVTGTASADPADQARTLWYESVAGVAEAQATSTNIVRRTAVSPGDEIVNEETDSVSSQKVVLPDITPADVQAQLETSAAAGLSIVDVHFIGLLGGTAEVVVRPDKIAMLEGASELTHALLGPLGDGRRPYLVTYVDGRGDPQLILGFTPGLGGDNGQGIAWVASGVTTDAILGSPYVAK